MRGVEITRKIENLSPSAHVVHTTSKHVMDRTRNAAKCSKMKNVRSKRRKCLNVHIRDLVVFAVLA